MLDEPILLASGSPRRRELLTTLGLAVDVAPVDADESWHGDAPDAYLERVVDAKLALAERVAENRHRRVVLVADTTVVLDERLLAKPESEAENAAMMASLAGRTHEVKTRFAVAIRGGARIAQTVRTSVTFRALSPDEIARYARSGEGRDKAGGYAIQGLGSFAVSAIAGSYTNVVGLPTCEVIVALSALGVLRGFPGDASF